MAFSHIVGGTTFTEASFEGNAYANETTGFPKALEKMVEHVANAYRGTSVTSNAVGTGSKTWTVTNANSQIPAFAVGMPVRVARTSAPTTTYLQGEITAFTASTGSTTVNVSSSLGSGTHTDWTITIGGHQTTASASPLGLAAGGTGAANAAAALTSLGAMPLAGGTITGNVGIGASPSERLHVDTASSGLPAIRLSHSNSGADNFNIQCGTPGVSNSGLTIRDIDAAANRIVVDSSGNVSVATGNLVIGTVGKGIDFSAQTATSVGTTTSELLDHYEEGTFTPTLVAAAGSGTIAYGAQAGRYIRIGSLCYLSIRLITTSISSRTGNLSIHGLPFTANAQNSAEASVGAVSGFSITAGTYVSGHCGNGSATITLYNWDTTDGPTVLQHSEWSDNGDIMLNITVET